MRDLEVPWGIALAADGGLFIGERPGRIRWLAPGADSAVLWAALDVYATEEGVGPESGLLGLAVAPGRAGAPVLYVVATTWRSPGDRDRSLVTRLGRRLARLVSPIGDLKYKNQVLRLSRTAGDPVRVDVIVDDLLTNHYHAGGALGFGPDGMLYVSLGDATIPRLARSPSHTAGKVLRYTPDGGIPGDNPIPGSPIWASGLRNTQSFTWLPDGRMIAVDHGPTGMPQEGGRAGLDELNMLRAGGDLGWPDVVGWGEADGIETPIWVWSDAIAPTGIDALADTAGRWSGRIVVAGLRGSLEEFALEMAEGRWRVTGHNVVSRQQFGRLRSLRSAPDGSLYLTTSNRDARGQPRPGDDLLLRLTLAR